MRMRKMSVLLEVVAKLRTLRRLGCKLVHTFFRDVSLLWMMR